MAEEVKRRIPKPFCSAFLGRVALQSGQRMHKYTLHCISSVTFPGQQRCSSVPVISVPGSATDVTLKRNVPPFSGSC